MTVNYYTDSYGAGLPNTAQFQYWNSTTQEWIDVENQSAESQKVSAKRTDVTYHFDTVKTSRLRLNMSKTKTNGKGCIAIMEMSATAKETAANKTSIRSNQKSSTGSSKNGRRGKRNSKKCTVGS